jgi:NAD(P)-dependent dehydrogenase (short-subunit alcohol dehydrogenase family)
MALDPHRLDGKAVLVTGAARGIGRAVALAAASAGARVYAVDLLADELRQTAQALGGGHHTEVFDLTGTAEIAGLCARAAETLGGLHGLAHVAGLMVRRAELAEVTEDDWDRQVDVNLKATFFLDREAARLMPAGGSIVNFASQAWWTGGLGGSVVYAATKGGVVSLTRGLARSLGPRDIRVNAVAPGFVETGMLTGGLGDQARAELIGQVPMGRFGRPDEPADAVIFLLSDASSYITGTTLNVSGGQLLY